MELKGHVTAEACREAGVCARVLLDGAEVRDVFEAHTEEGWLVRFVREAEGYALHQDGAFIRERLTGAVRVEVTGPR